MTKNFNTDFIYICTFIFTRLETLVHQAIVEFCLFIVHRPFASLVADIILEIIVRMKVDAEVIHDVVEEAFHFFCISDMRVLSVLSHHIQELFANTLYERVSNDLTYYKLKARVLTSACPIHRGLPQP